MIVAILNSRLQNSTPAFANGLANKAQSARISKLVCGNVAAYQLL